MLFKRICDLNMYPTLLMKFVWQICIYIKFQVSHLMSFIKLNKCIRSVRVCNNVVSGKEDGVGVRRTCTKRVFMGGGTARIPEGGQEDFFLLRRVYFLCWY